MSRDSKKSLENIANGFKAAHKIQNLKNSSFRSEEGMPGQSPPELLKEMLQVLAEFSPDKYRGSLSTSLQQSSLYADTYKNLKQHIRESSSHRAKSDDLIRTMQIMKPVLTGRNQHNIEKILKIYEILKS